MTTMLRTLLPTLLLGWIPLITLAALPPQYAAERQLGLLEGAVEARNKANTVAELTVRSVSKKARNDGDCWQSVTYTVTGTIDAVTRAPKALEPGSKLTFTYTTKQYRDDTGCAGPQVWYDVVRKGDRLYAHLDCDENDACTAVTPYGSLRSDAALESAIAGVREEAGLYSQEPEEPPPPKPKAGDGE